MEVINVTKIEGTEIYHLDHSGVAVRTAHHFLVFDYYNDTPVNQTRNIENGVLTTEGLKDEEEVLVFVSHSHGDHFNPVIFDWEKQCPDIKYILSHDLNVRKKDNYYKMEKYQDVTIDDVYVETYGTTDQGVSYYVEVDGLNIFHSGDLNWWHWKKFTPEERKQEEEDYKAELEKLKEQDIDIAFVPVDPRLEEYYYLAGQYFAKMIEPELIVPIHFRENYWVTTKFIAENTNLAVEVAELKRRGDKIVF